MGERVNFGIRLKKWRNTTICSKLFLFNPEKRVDLRGSAGADAEDLGWILQGWKSRAGLTSWERNMYIYIYVDQRWELLAVLLQVFGLKKLLWMYDYLKILPSSHNALCTISQIFLWTVFVIIKNQYILLRPNTRSWAKLSTQHFPFWSPDVFDFLVPCLDGFWRSFFKCFMWHEMYAKHSSKCTVLQLREAIFLRIQPEGSPQFIAFSHLPRIFE